MKGSAAALLQRSAGRVVIASSSSSSTTGSLRDASVWLAKSRWSSELLVAPCGWGTRVAAIRTLASSSMPSTTSIQSQTIVRAAGGASNKNSSLVNHPQQQALHHQQLQWRHMVMITKTKAGGDDTDKDDGDVVVNIADATLDTTSNITPSPSPFIPDEETHQLLKITDACWNKIEQLAAAKRQKKKSEQGESDDDNNNIYLRVLIDAGGCSGFSYQFEFDTDENLSKDDLIFTRPQKNNKNHNCVSAPRVVVDAGSLEFIQGSTIDYVQEMIKSSFQVRDNPQSESACGCGSSFAVKNFSANPALD